MQAHVSVHDKKRLPQRDLRLQGNIARFLELMLFFCLSCRERRQESEIGGSWTHANVTHKWRLVTIKDINSARRERRGASRYEMPAHHAPQIRNRSAIPDSSTTAGA